MVHISHKYIKDFILRRMHEIFFEVLRRSTDKDSFFKVINELYSPAEKIMFAKRVTLIYMLYKKIDYDTISKTLKISTSTISRYAILFNTKNSELASIFKKIEKEEAYVQFFDDLLISIFIQPGVKIGHWKHYWDSKKRKQIRESTGL